MKILFNKLILCTSNIEYHYMEGQLSFQSHELQKSQRVPDDRIIVFKSSYLCNVF